MYYEKLYFFEDNNLEINNEKINFLIFLCDIVFFFFEFDKNIDII